MFVRLCGRSAVSLSQRLSGFVAVRLSVCRNVVAVWLSVWHKFVGFCGLVSVQYGAKCALQVSWVCSIVGRRELLYIFKEGLCCVSVQTGYCMCVYVLCPFPEALVGKLLLQRDQCLNLTVKLPFTTSIPENKHSYFMHFCITFSSF